VPGLRFGLSPVSHVTVSVHRAGMNQRRSSEELRSDSRLVDLIEEAVEHFIIEGKYNLIEELLGYDPVQSAE
jgi:hypothetical protein